MEFYQDAKFKVWVLMPKITGALSIVGSSLIVHDVLFRKNNTGQRSRNQKKKLQITTNRIVTLMSICDVIFTFIGYFLGTWLVPEETGIWWATGSRASCTFQGFVTHFFAGAATALNATLAVTYVLVVRYGYKDEALQKPIMSFLLLAFPVLVSLGFHIWGLVDDAYNWTGAWMCSIGPDPFICAFSPVVPCTRGINADSIDHGAMIFTQICFALIFISTILLYWTVLSKERATDRYAVDSSQLNRTQSTRVAWQGIWYAGSFFITWLPWWVGIIYEAVTDEQKPYWLVTTMAIMMPLQGFFNAIVYFRPRWLSKRRQTTSTSGSITSSLRQSRIVRSIFGVRSSLMKSSANNSSSAAAASETAVGESTSKLVDGESTSKLVDGESTSKLMDGESTSKLVDDADATNKNEQEC